MNNFKQFINEQENLDEDFTKWATPFIIAGSLMGGPNKAQAQEPTKKQSIVMAFDQETGKMVKTPMNQATFDTTQKKWIKSSKNTPTQPKTNTNPKSEPNKNIDAGEHALSIATHYYDNNEFSKAHHTFYWAWGNNNRIRNKTLKEWVKENVEIMTLHQAALLAEEDFLDKDTFDKLYKLHIQPFTNNIKEKNKKNWLYVGDFFRNFALNLNNLKNLGKKYGYPPFDFIENKTNESVINTAMDLATQYMGVPGPTELGMNIDNKSISQFGKFVANQLDLIPLDKDTVTKYQKLCNSTPQKGIDSYKYHLYNKQKACGILCTKGHRSEDQCKKADCKKIKLRSGYKQKCPPMPDDFFRDDTTKKILGLS
jgi:hypothetical protein